MEGNPLLKVAEAELKELKSTNPGIELEVGGNAATNNSGR